MVTPAHGYSHEMISSKLLPLPSQQQPDHIVIHNLLQGRKKQFEAICYSYHCYTLLAQSVTSWDLQEEDSENGVRMMVVAGGMTWLGSVAVEDDIAESMI